VSSHVKHGFSGGKGCLGDTFADNAA